VGKSNAKRRDFKPVVSTNPVGMSFPKPEWVRFIPAFVLGSYDATSTCTHGILVHQWSATQEQNAVPFVLERPKHQLPYCIGHRVWRVSIVKTGCFMPAPKSNLAKCYQQVCW